MTLALLPDVEAFVSSWLRSRPAVSAVVGDRVFTTLPAVKEWPALRLERIGGAPPFDEMVVDAAVIQFSAWGGPKAVAWLLANTVRAELAALPGPHATAFVSRVMPGAARYLADDSFEPPRPRVIFDATIYISPIIT